MKKVLLTVAALSALTLAACGNEAKAADDTNVRGNNSFMGDGSYTHGQRCKRQCDILNVIHWYCRASITVVRSW